MRPDDTQSQGVEQDLHGCPEPGKAFCRIARVMIETYLDDGPGSRRAVLERGAYS
jgi:hypothetical protein